jgi:hypothetical protein
MHDTNIMISVILVMFQGAMHNAVCSSQCQGHRTAYLGELRIIERSNQNAALRTGLPKPYFFCI